ncbi:hypothetical protein N7466_004430 [Penicillium verhagenii]|uniref:uncharacterized protein n=1 Tax=Penicillium verhagenii TaxID=1562060 RepID=UPI002544E74E|nr:uncharacterized protein N7466_004430 [Penicillium verhagenii]KAJ5934883.1 hypothetical protein N7466_004430 [Penicillium verhagenii]
MHGPSQRQQQTDFTTRAKVQAPPERFAVPSARLKVAVCCDAECVTTGSLSLVCGISLVRRFSRPASAGALPPSSIGQMQDPETLQGCSAPSACADSSPSLHASDGRLKVSATRGVSSSYLTPISRIAQNFVCF